MADGFLSRWSKRKAGKDVETEKVGEELVEPSTPPTIKEPAPPPVTLEDVEKIDRFDPDFSAFMRPDVDPTVQQAALKKMFSDPHFNVMDGLDIYIDDYSNPELLPPEMLRGLVQSDLLGIFKTAAEEVSKSNQEAGISSNAELTNQAANSEQSTDLISQPSLQKQAVRTALRALASPTNARPLCFGTSARASRSPLRLYGRTAAPQTYARR